MFRFGLVSEFSRLAVTNAVTNNVPTRLINTGINPLFFKATSCLYAEPLKKKKRIDPAIIKQREERKKRRLEKQIRRLEKNARQLKPIDELEVPLEFIDGKEERMREPVVLTPQQQEERTLLHKEWARYKTKQHLKDMQMVDRLVFSQQRALDELRKESEELYQAAIQINPLQLPFTVRGPVRTPPIKDYDSPDGEYTDVSKKW
ncbi:large ribosomal subunit protein mL40 [Periplaneta americana]|uniref:large ribosomal subunit protein mL40 n=1 Tax=Periplaneta americana TaxID=6978 RepID=UPI0037E9A06D